MSSHKKLNSFFVLIFCLASSFVFSNNGKQYQFLSPTPNSKFNSLENTIIIREGSTIDQSSLVEGTIIVSGSKSGKVSGRLILASDQRTIIFKPNNFFLPDETIEVTISEGIRTIGGRSLQAYNYTFRT